MVRRGSLTRWRRGGAFPTPPGRVENGQAREPDLLEEGKGSLDTTGKREERSGVGTQRESAEAVPERPLVAFPTDKRERYWEPKEVHEVNFEANAVCPSERSLLGSLTCFINGFTLRLRKGSSFLEFGGFTITFSTSDP